MESAHTTQCANTPEDTDHNSLSAPALPTVCFQWRWGSGDPFFFKPRRHFLCSLLL